MENHYMFDDYLGHIRDDGQIWDVPDLAPVAVPREGRILFPKRWARFLRTVNRVGDLIRGRGIQ